MKTAIMPITQQAMIQLCKCAPIGIAQTQAQYDAAGGDFFEDAQMNLGIVDFDSYEAAWHTMAKHGRDVKAMTFIPSPFGFSLFAVLERGSDAINFYNGLPKKMPRPNPSPNLLSKPKTFALIEPTHVRWTNVSTGVGAVDRDRAAELCGGNRITECRRNGYHFLMLDLPGGMQGQRFNRLASILSGVELYGPVVVAK